MIYTWPSGPNFVPMGSSFRPKSISSLSTSPHNGAHKADSRGQIWVAELTFNNRAEDDVRELQAFLNRLEGPSNPVRLFDWWRSTPLLLKGISDPFSDGTFFDDGTGWGEGYSLNLITAVARGDRVFVVEGFPVSQEVLSPGDLVGLSGFVHEVRYGVSSNASGQAAITVQPGARAGGAVGDNVSTYRPTMPMRMASDADAVIFRAFHWGEGFTLRFVEDVP